MEGFYERNSIDWRAVPVASAQNPANRIPLHNRTRDEMGVRVATFNAENLFARYRFRSNFSPTEDDGFTINDLAFSIHDEDSKKITGKAIRESNADIVCLQEVENVGVLDRFNSRYLGGQGYRHQLVVDGHDPRYIDVAVLSRYPIEHIRTHRHERNRANTTWKFSRDCLEVDLDVNGKNLSLFVNHLKSMMGGRDETHDRRKEQAERVAEIVDEWYEDSDYEGNFIVLGDLNDYPADGTALESLLNHPGLVNVVNRLPADEQWTHFWASGNKYSQLDYLLLSRSLAESNANGPTIMRKGLPYRAARYDGDRLPDVGDNYPKASDHAVLYMDIELD